MTREFTLRDTRLLTSLWFSRTTHYIKFGRGYKIKTEKDTIEKDTIEKVTIEKVTKDTEKVTKEDTEKVTEEDTSSKKTVSKAFYFFLFLLFASHKFFFKFFFSRSVKGQRRRHQLKVQTQVV